MVEWKDRVETLNTLFGENKELVPVSSEIPRAKTLKTAALNMTGRRVETLS